MHRSGKSYVLVFLFAASILCAQDDIYLLVGAGDTLFAFKLGNNAFPGGERR